MVVQKCKSGGGPEMSELLSTCLCSPEKGNTRVDMNANNKNEHVLFCKINLALRQPRPLGAGETYPTFSRLTSDQHDR